MNKALRYCLLYMVLLQLSPMTWAGGGLALQVQNSRHQAMGGAGTGLQLNAAAMYYNPGAVPFVRQQQLIVGVSAAHSITAYADVSTVTTTQTINRPITPLSGYVLLRPNRDGPISMGVALYSPYGTNTRWSDTWKGRIIVQEFTLSTLAIQPTLSLRLGTRWGAGIGLAILSGSLGWRRARPEGSQTSPYAETYAATGRSLRLNGGLYYKPSRKLSVGLSFLSPCKLRFSQGEAQFIVPTSLVNQFPATTFTTEIPLPATLSAGIGFYPDDRLTVAVDVSYMNWRTLDTLRLYMATQNAYITDRIEIWQWHNTFAVRMGAEYVANERVAIRGGLAWEESPTSSDYFSPMLLDATSISATAGLGIRISQHLQADMSLRLAYTGQYSNLNIVKNFGGIYKTNTFITAINLSYTW